LLLSLAFSAQAQTLVGASDGLYRLDGASRSVRLLAGTEVRKIVRSGDGYFFLTSRGVLHSRDLSSFQERNAGIPVKTVKTYEGGVKGFVKEVQELKDLEVDPYDPATLITCTKDQVFLSRDSGASWQAIPSPAPQPGMKAVAVTSRPELLVFASHAIKGPFVRTATGSWREIGGDLGRSDVSGSADEVSDIVVEARADGPVVWAANSFLPRLYRYDFESRAFRAQYKGSEDFASFDSLSPRAGGLLFVTDGAVMRLDTDRGTVTGAAAETKAVMNAAALIGSQLEALYVPAAAGSSVPALNLCELWLASFRSDKPYRAAADGRHGIYLQTGFMVKADSRAKYDALLTERGLDTVVVDLKDAWVYLLTGRSGDDVVERRRWSGLQSISPGARAFAAGRAELRGARMTMAPSGREPPLVVLHDGDDDAVVRRAVWAGRHDNEYWNPLTQVSIALGVAAMSAILPLALKAGIPSLIGALTLTAAFSPILPVLPPGVVFFFAYRRFWRRARYCRARRDTERLRGGDVADAWHRRAYGATAASALALAGALAVNGWLLIFVLRRFL